MLKTEELFYNNTVPTMLDCFTLSLFANSIIFCKAVAVAVWKLNCALQIYLPDWVDISHHSILNKLDVVGAILVTIVIIELTIREVGANCYRWKIWMRKYFYYPEVDGIPIHLHTRTDILCEWPSAITINNGHIRILLRTLDCKQTPRPLKKWVGVR